MVAATLSQESSSTLNIELDSLDVISPLDSIPQDATPQDSITEVILTDSIANDSLKPKAKKSFLDDRLDGKNTDSLFYDVKNKMVYIYNEGDVTYQNKNLKADFMQVNMDSREIFAYGKKDTVNGALTTIKPVFTDGGTSYTMDTITYNLKSEKARIKGVAVQEGEGWLIGNNVKKMPDNTINITEGKYTTCDNVEHPHFYLAMSKAKVIPNDKVVTGYAYMVLADVPLPFLAIPEGFFPLNMEYKSGLLMPSYGEDSSRGFFLRDLGYYLILNDHADVTLLAGIYSLGSWEASVSSRYVKRYKYSGNLSFNYSNVKVGLSTDPDYTEQNAYKVVWSHTQDAKANPSSSFSASVNFTTSGYTAYAATTISDMLATQTNSSIAYSKSWSGTPFSLSTNMAVSQNSQTEAISMTLPTVVFSASKFYPFKKSDSSGKEKWYEKISMSYTGKMTNSVTTTEDEFFEMSTIENMTNGIQHTIPINASFTAFNYINLVPNVNYTERWYFQKEEREWNPETQEVEYLDPEYGFYRLYDYNVGASANTTIYGMIQNKNPKGKVQAIRHVLTPSLGFSYAPNFGSQKYGYYQTVQSDSTGTTTTYSPYSGNSYGVPSSGETMALTFSLSQNLEMKVLSDRDTSGMRKIKLIENLSLSGSYNFLADSMKLSTISASFKTTLFKNFGLQLSATIDPYKVTPEGVRYDELFFPGRITSTGWSFGYTFKARESGAAPAINDINSIPIEYTNPFYDPYGTLDPTLRRQYMAASYYDFSLPWNFGFNYSVSYGISYTNNGTTGYERNVTQTLGFNGSLVITKNWGASITGGFDLETMSLTTSSVSITRDLHCWQMSFQWIPFGNYKSWSFNIGVKAASLADLKYDKSSSYFDNMY